MKPRVCILTDSTVQVPGSTYPGHEAVHILPMRIRCGEEIFQDNKDPRFCTRLLGMANGSPLTALAPSIEDFEEAFINLGQKYQSVITILISSHLSATFQNAQIAAAQVKGPESIYIIDSQTTAIGMGLLVQAAAQAIQQGINEADVNCLVRGMVPHIYTLLSLQSLRYLSNSGFLDPTQAIIGEMLGLLPVFVLEGGKLLPVQKARSSRHLIDIFHEFVSEFFNVKHLAIIQGVPPHDQDVRNLVTRLREDFSMPSLTEHSLGAALMAILGPRCLGIVVFDEYEGENLP